MLVVGDQEAENSAVNVRKYGEQNSETISLEEFVKKAVAEAKNKIKKHDLIEEIMLFYFSNIGNKS